jgi:hypothetical protein
MGLYGRQWELPVNLWNDLEISGLPQFSVIIKVRLINELSTPPHPEFQLCDCRRKNLILKFLLLYPLCSNRNGRH